MQAWGVLAADACTQLLGATSRQFSSVEIAADQLLQAEWPLASRDVCEGLNDVPSIAFVRTASGMAPDE
jgi:hypothetical protein